MPNEHVPESIIVIDGSLDDIKRYWLCCYAPFGRIYCEKNTRCENCEIAETITEHRDKIKKTIEKNEH